MFTKYLRNVSRPPKLLTFAFEFKYIHNMGVPRVNYKYIKFGNSYFTKVVKCYVNKSQNISQTKKA